MLKVRLDDEDLLREERRVFQHGADLRVGFGHYRVLRAKCCASCAKRVADTCD